MLQTLFYAFLSILTLFTLTIEAAEGIYSNPDIHEERIVFQSGGKVWLGTLNEGKYIAYPLHNYGGISKYPKFSKDGKKIAFISNFETGSTYEIYLTDIDGNSLERLTYEALGSEDEIFFSDGDEITFSCLTKQSHRESCLKKVDIRTKKVVEMGVYQGTQAVCIDKNSYLFVRFQKQKAIQKYRGGQLRQIYKTKETKAGLEIKKIPLFDEANCYSPTICQSELYFLSDVNSKARIYKYTDRGLVDVWGQDGFSIQSLTSKGGKLVMASFGDIWIYEPKTSKAMKVQLELRGLPQRETSWFSIQNELDIALNFRNPNNYFSLHEVLAIEDSGERSALLVRGSIILNSKGSDGFVRVKPDGEGYYYDIAARNGNLFALYGDASGNWLHIFYENGEKGTHFLDKRTRNRLVVSYDGKFVLTTSAQQELFLFDVGQNKETLVDKNIPFLLGKEGVSFSFDNQWIAYSVQKRNLFFQLKLFSVEQGKSYSITATEVDGYNPVWHPQQAALYFLNRNERNIGLARSIDHSNLVSTAKTILSAVSFNGQNPFSMDEVKELIPLKGDLFTRKVYKNPMTNTPGILFGTKNGMVILGKSTSFIPFKNGNEVLVKQSFDDLFFSATSDKGILLDGKEFYWADISNGLSCIQLKPVEVTNQKIDHDSQGERKHFFYSILRNYQSYFFDQNIKDGFWDDLKNRYELLLERARNRVDFASLISMMLAELNTLHIFVEPYEPSNASFESQSLPLDVEYSEEKGSACR
ncbi:MAG: hypothetical protein FJZ60_02160 [Chlamydiae bacterium]|nr:hypothetical protein [Chlamydiota bacterium]